MKYVEKIASADQGKRRAALMDVLRDEKIPFAHYHQKMREDWVA